MFGSAQPSIHNCLIVSVMVVVVIVVNIMVVHSYHFSIIANVLNNKIVKQMTCKIVMNSAEHAGA